ncbi:MAG: Ig-like domain-containing protein, partial [Gemmatimonadaceae bacterium]
MVRQVRLAARWLCVLAVVAGCKDAPTGPPAVATVAVTVPSSSFTAGTSQQLSVVVKDANGSVLTDRHISWTTLNSSVATVSGGGLLTATFPGTTTVFATVDGKSGSGEVTVLPIPVTFVSITPLTIGITVGNAQQLTAILRDATGSFVDGRTVVWTSSDVSVASVSGSGLVTGVAVGTTTISATSEGKTGTASVVVAEKGTPPAITAITPTTLIPGTSAIITGFRFDTLIAGNTVSVRGVGALVLSATSTQLTINVPCVNSGNANVTVSNGNLTSPVFVKSVSVTPRTIAVGQALVLTDNVESACTELLTSSATARYLVTVFSGATSQNTLTNFEIGGNTPATGTTVANVTPRVNVSTPAAFQWTEEVARDDAHWQMLERDRRQYESLHAKAQRLPRALAALRATLVPLPGEARDFYYTFTGGCSSTSTVMHTTATYVGTRSVIWEDDENTLQSALNPDYLAFYQRLGEIFDKDQYESLKNNFGDPLLRDAVTDADGRVHMVFSQKLNGSGAAAYVTSCDQFPRTLAAGSNFGEVFYGSVPTAAGSNVNSTTFADGWFYFMARTVVHEVKHSVSVAARVQNNAPSTEQSWLEEGTARHAEELWVRESLHH